MSEGHHACLGGNAACEGNKEATGADGDGTAVATVRAAAVVEAVAVDVD